MVKVIKALIVVLMVITWLTTGVLLIPASGWRGRVATVAAGLAVNLLLAFWYSHLGHPRTGFRDWWKR